MKIKSRSTGCWTCRIRHVKCDSGTPSCKECTSRQTRCHGYGPRPSWMDGGQLEATERFSIKASIKKNFRRIRKKQDEARRQSRASWSPYQTERESGGTERESGGIADHQAQSDPQALPVSPRRPTPAPATNSPECNTAGGYTGNFSPITSSASRLIPKFAVVHNEAVLFREPTPNGNFGSVNTYEASLLMHYFDHVFPWQFPYYNSYSRTGNRGWLLQLLTKRGPLYHAAISLSSLHENATQGMNDHYLESQKVFDHHSTALKELCEFLRSEKATEFQQDEQLLTEFLACSIMLMSFEVLRGGRSDWQPHLNAVVSTIGPMSPTSFINTAGDKLDKICSPSKTISQLNGNNTRSGLGFLYANALWFDIFACVSTGRTPVLPYKSWLAIEQLKMEDVMGCHNWALSLIGDITHLRQWKDDMDKQGLLSVCQLVTQGHSIESELEERISNLYSGSDETRGKAHSNWITHLFALAALVQLHTIVSGPLPSLPEMQRTVQRAIDLLTSRPENCSLQGIVWPLCVLGCMAEPQSQFFFEELVSSMVIEFKELGNSFTVLQIMKGCWGLQQNGRKDCTAAMSELNIHALLV